MSNIERTKNANEENFPVGSFFIPKKMRPHIKAFYDFARTADDIADEPSLSSKEKLKRLTQLEAVLTGDALPDIDTMCAEVLRQSLKECNVTDQHAKDLLKAFYQDAKAVHVYHTWEDLITYCHYSAGSVGRFMLDLHGENAMAYWPSDALCAVLQLNNHLQDCKEDYQDKNRVYIPKEWFIEQRLTRDALVDRSTCKDMQCVFNKLLNGIDGLLIEGSSLPLVVNNVGLRIEICIIFRLAQRLLMRLKKQDILKHKVNLTKSDWVIAVLQGFFGGLRRKKIKCINKKDIKPPKT